MNRRSWLSHITVTDIRTNTDDFDEARWLISKATEEALANRVRVGEELPNQRLIDDRNRHGVFCVLDGESAASQDRDGHGREEVWTDV